MLIFVISVYVQCSEADKLPIGWPLEEWDQRGQPPGDGRGDRPLLRRPDQDHVVGTVQLHSAQGLQSKSGQGGAYWSLIIECMLYILYILYKLPKTYSTNYY